MITKPIMIDMRGKSMGTVSGLWQWDYGKKLYIQDDALPPYVEVHFSLQPAGGSSVTRIGTTKDGVACVTIPDSMLENNRSTSGYSIYAFIYLSDSGSGYTVKCVTMFVQSRPKPEFPGGNALENTVGHFIELLSSKVNSDQGVENAGKILMVGEDGQVTTLTLGDGLGIHDGALVVTGEFVAQHSDSL